MSQTFDVVVIGAGTGGYPCAIRLAQLGKKVALVEDTYVGGVCLNVGCIPSKAIISSARRYHDVLEGEKFGITSRGVTLDFSKTQAWKQSIVAKLVGGVRQLLKGNGVTLLEGRAELVPGTGTQTLPTIMVNGEDIRATDIVIATGSHPIDLPQFPVDGKSVMGSKEVLALEEVPKRVVVLGGGYIGLELGCALKLLGAEVTVVEMLPRLLNGFDQDCVQVVARRLKSLDVKVKLETKAEEIVKVKGSKALRVTGKEGEETLPFDALVVTIGRKPRGKELKLERFGVKIDERGFIAVDDQLRTANPHIFAVGDVCGQPMLAHKATRDGEVCAEVIAGHDTSIQNKVIPAVVFCEPEMASAGMTEAEATAAGRKIGTARFPFAALGRALAAGEPDGFAKIVFDEKSHLVLGVHIVGGHATDLISECALAIEMGATLEDISLTVHPHPTLGEVMMETAKVGLGEAVHVLQPKPAAARHG